MCLENRKEVIDMLFKKINEEKAIKIARKNSNLPSAIHQAVIANFEKQNKVGILSFISLENPTTKIISKDGSKYWEVVFHSGDISWQELSDDYKTTEIYYDGEIADNKIAKCLINSKTGEFIYSGECYIQPEKHD